MLLARKILIPVLAVSALITTVSVAGEATAWATITGYGFGTGTTAAAAQVAARRDLEGDYRGCTGLSFDTQGSGDHWSSEVVATCQFAT